MADFDPAGLMVGLMKCNTQPTKPLENYEIITPPTITLWLYVGKQRNYGNGNKDESLQALCQSVNESCKYLQSIGEIYMCL